MQTWSGPPLVATQRLIDLRLRRVQLQHTFAPNSPEKFGFDGEGGGVRDGPLVFHHTCKLGFEGIVSKRKGSAEIAPELTGHGLPLKADSGHMGA